MAKKNELTHLAVILDGNGRWAEKHGLPRVKGHEAGAERVIDLVENLKDTSIRFLTLYAFSNENWNRSEEEVSALMELLYSFLDRYGKKMVENKIRLLVTGRRDRMPQKCLDQLDSVIKMTAENFERTVIFALNYGGRQEIADAVKSIAQQVKNGSIDPDAIDEKTVADHLYHPSIPDPDLLIRTSGELRISNFLLWQISYAEFYFTDTFWPDFDKAELNKAIDSYYHRNRRFGGRN